MKKLIVTLFYIGVILFVVLAMYRVELRVITDVVPVTYVYVDDTDSLETVEYEYDTIHYRAITFCPLDTTTSETKVMKGSYRKGDIIIMRHD